MNKADNDIEFRSDLRVTYVDSMGDDKRIAQAARVSTNTDTSARPHERLVRRLWEDGHTSPFEHNTLTVKVSVPIFVAREWMRHRTQSFNEISGRYSDMAPVFYAPNRARPVVQSGKSIDYDLSGGSWEQTANVIFAHESLAMSAWEEYKAMLDKGIAREVARNVLPLSLYTEFYATASLLNWLKFVRLRSDPSALHEIREAALSVEQIIKSVWPVSHSAFRGKADEGNEI